MTGIYKNGKIYCLYNLITKIVIYIGSTTQSLNRRKYEHKSKSKYKNSKLYIYIRKIGFENIEIRLIENFPCNSRLELFEREGYYQNLHKKTIYNTVSNFNNKKKIDNFNINNNYLIDKTIMNNTEFLRLLKIEFPNIHTFKQYEYNINRFSAKYTNNYYDDISNYEKINNYFNNDLKDKSVNVKHRFICNIKKTIEVLKINVDFKDKLDLLCKDLNNKRIIEEDEKELKELNFNYNDINECIETFDKNSKEYLYWMILTCIPPRRQDWGKAMFIDSETYDKIESNEKINYVIINKEHKAIGLTFHNFKTNIDTSKGPEYRRIWQRYLLNDCNFNYNQKIGNILNPDKLNKLLYETWVKNGCQNYQYVLNDKFTPMNDNQMNTFLKNKVFKPLIDKNKNITQNNMRRLFITETLVKNFDILTIRNKKDIGEDMGQYSIETQQYYISNLINEEEEIITEEIDSDSDSDSDNDSDNEIPVNSLFYRKEQIAEQIKKLSIEYDNICQYIKLETELSLLKTKLNLK
jgi:hypothetical protein